MELNQAQKRRNDAEQQRNQAEDIRKILFLFKFYGLQLQ